MTHHSPVKAVITASHTTSRPQLPPLIGNLAQLRSALTDKRILIARIEAAWVATAETAITKHLPKHVRIGDRATWDGETYKRYMAEAERIEPKFKPRLRRLLAEIDNLERLLSPAPLRTTQNAA